MSPIFRKSGVTIVVAGLAVMVGAASMVGAHNAPNAGHVTFAHKAGTAKRVTGFKPLRLRKLTPSATNANQTTARNQATKVQLFSKGAFRIYAKCYKVITDPTNPLVAGEVYIRTTVGGAVLDAANGSNSGNGFFGPATPEVERELNSTASAAGSGDPGTLNITDGDSMAFFAAVRQLQVNGNVFVGTKVGTPEVGNGVFGTGDRCIIAGTITSHRS